MASRYCAIYDFELFPYALGDVLTWNVQTAIRAEEAGCTQVDVYICLDPRYPANVYQRGLIVAENCSLHFNELFGAFYTHPMLGNVFIFSSRDELLETLRALAERDAVVAAVLAEYEGTLKFRDHEGKLGQYFVEQIFSHARINRFAEQNGRIPLLAPSRGCEPDVQGLFVNLFGAKRIVVVHPRLRRLDYGLGAEHSHRRDSDFLEWYEFLRGAGTRHPDVQFAVVGRLQEKPIEFLRLPNVTTLRPLGLGLGHELTLMLQSDLFIGTSSGFAAMANFSTLPYFITHMRKETCKAYAIPQGAPRLPFATADQFLIYERESAPMLLGLLERGLGRPPRPRPPAVARDTAIGSTAFQKTRAESMPPAATTGRFFLDDLEADQETAFLVRPKLDEAYEALRSRNQAGALAIGERIAHAFPRLRANHPELVEILAGRAVPPPLPGLRQRLRGYLDAINAHALPLSWRGGALHRMARWIKHHVFQLRPY